MPPYLIPPELTNFRPEVRTIRRIPPTRLDTPTGQVKITSEIAGVQVELLDEKDRVTKLTIENKEERPSQREGGFIILDHPLNSAKCPL